MEQSISWEANNSRASAEITRIFIELKILQPYSRESTIRPCSEP
jgi:hypothetical protein